MNLIATSDLTDFMMLPDEVRTEIESWQSRFQTITPPIHRALSGIAAAMGASAKTARRKYDAWRKQGWRGLVNHSKVRETGISLSPEFIEYWCQLCRENGRKYLPAYREFVRQFKAGEPIPGIGPSVPRGSIPRGFSYDNLILHKQTKLEETASRIGIVAAAPFRPKVLTTRFGLRVGQYIMFDDMWHDFKIVAIGQRKPMRLLQLHAHDLFSGCQFARGLKARMEDPETGKSINLHEDEMLFLVAHVLTEFGFCKDGCYLIVEHGTAAISEQLEKALFDLSAGKIIVLRSGIEGASSLAGQYCGRGKGNFRFKASLESLGNLIHNETANLLMFPGQTGSNSRINCPEELHGRERAMEPLALAIAALPSQVINQLRLPFLEVNAAKWAVEFVMERINGRTQHELEGWLESGLSTTDFEVPGIGTIPSDKFLTLPAEQQLAIQTVATPIARRMSPREVFDIGRRDLVKFRPEQTAWLMKDKQGREVTVGNDHLITFEDSSISPEPLRYLAHHFAPGDKFLAVPNPWSPENLQLFDPKGRWVGQVAHWQRVRRDDIDALHRQMGAAAKIEKELLAPLAARGADLLKQRLDATLNNIDVLSPAPEQKAFTKREGSAAAADILAPSEMRPEDSTGAQAAADELLAALSSDPPQT